jgi:uncharacterized protein (TIGR02246 family)
VTAPTSGADEERAVVVAFEGLYEAATRARDADAAVRHFAGDDDITMWGSDETERAVGPPAIRAFLQAVADGPSSIEFTWGEVRVHVEGDVAWVNARGDLTVVPAGEQRRTSAYRVTGVFVRRAGRWLWHTHSGSEPNEA